jgi:DNA ligase-associated metallophosphoesterase
MSTKTTGSIAVEFAGETWELLPDNAIYSSQRQALIVADVHVGKGATFRALGVPVPAGSSAKDLSRISALLKQTGARRLIILGDFFHAKAGRDDELHNTIRTWRESHAGIPMLLIRGNHDRRAGRVLSEWNIEEANERHADDGILLCHAPCEGEAMPHLCGHVHPVFAMKDFDRTSVRVPCFVLDPNLMMLPSFGSMTGGYRIETQPERRIYLVAGRRIVAVPREE